MTIPRSGTGAAGDEAGDDDQEMSSRTAWTICSANAWWSVFAKKRVGRPRPGTPVHDDLLAFEDDKGRTRHDFTAATSLDQVWLTDIERHEALLNLAVVKGHRWRCVAACRLKLRTA